jgi:hypothetical protein
MVSNHHHIVIHLSIMNKWQIVQDETPNHHENFLKQQFNNSQHRSDLIVQIFCGHTFFMHAHHKTPGRIHLITRILLQCTIPIISSYRAVRSSLVCFRTHRLEHFSDNFNTTFRRHHQQQYFLLSTSLEFLSAIPKIRQQHNESALVAESIFDQHSNSTML